MKKKLRFMLLFILCLIASNTYSQWYIVSSGGTRDLNSISFYFSWGYAVGDSGLVRKSVNGGSIWSTIAINTLVNLNRVHAFGTNDAFICGNLGQIFKTSNGGTNWIAQTTPASYNYYDMDFLNGNTGIVVGDSRRFAATANGGTNWILGQLNTPGPANLDYISVEWIDNNTTIVGSADTLMTGGYVSYMHRSTNNGVSYSQVWVVGSPGRCGFLDIQFVDANIGYALCQNQTVYKSITAGYSWFPYNIGFPAKSIHFVNALTGYACGDNGQLRKTTNGGVNWLSQTSPTALTMRDNFFVDSVKGFSAGFDGFIINTSNGGSFTGINQIGNELPDEFSLHQNYPNPFNPSTNLKFDVPAPGFVKLIIYNVLGGEVQTLVNEKLQAGTYEAQFDAANFPSGTYFYRLEAGSFTQTRKMVLVK